MRRICTICARGGSKGVKNKNIRTLNGMPLIAHSILQAKHSGCFHTIAVSSDSDDILTTAQKWNVDILIKRPADLANDTAAKLPAIKHALLTAETLTDATFDTLVDLDATSPLRLPEDISNAVRLSENNVPSNVVTGTIARRSPYFNLVERDGNGYVHLSKSPTHAVRRRQDSPQCFDMNASVYVWNRNRFLETPSIFYPDTLLYEMPDYRSLDIDTELDFRIVEIIMNEQKK